MEANKLLDNDNKWEKLFFILIVLALIKRFIISIFKFLWIPFKIAFIFYIFKHLGYDFSSVFNNLNNISLGIIDWFHDKIIKFLELFKNND